MAVPSIPPLNFSAPTGPSGAAADRYQVVQVFGNSGPTDYSGLANLLNELNYPPQHTGYILENGTRQRDFQTVLETSTPGRNWLILGAIVIGGVILYARSR
jgi:hypothetical protein